MSGRAKGWRSAGVAAYAISLALAAGGGSAEASIISAMPGIDFSTQATTITFGLASFIFSDIAGALPGDPPAAVSTTGSAKVSTIFGGIADFGAGATIDQTGELYSFAAYPAATVIPNSAADDFMGLAFKLSGQVHYGYAEVIGTELVSYGYESQADTAIRTAAVREPAALAVFGLGLLGVAALRFRRRPPSASAASRKRAES